MKRDEDMKRPGTEERKNNKRVILFFTSFIVSGVIYGFLFGIIQDTIHGFWMRFTFLLFPTSIYVFIGRYCIHQFEKLKKEKILGADKT